MNWAGNYKVPLESFQIAQRFRAELYPRQLDNFFSVFMLTNKIGNNLTLSLSEGKMSLKKIWKFRSLASISTFLSSVTWLSLSFWVSVLFCHQTPGNCLYAVCCVDWTILYCYRVAQQFWFWPVGIKITVWLGPLYDQVYKYGLF